MKKKFLTASLLAVLCISFTSCKDSKNQSTETIENTTEAMVDDVEETTNEVSETLEDATAEKEAAVEEATETIAEEGTGEVMEHNEEGVTVTYTHEVDGQVIKDSKVFIGSQEDVEAAVKKFSDSLTKLHPGITITTK